MHEHPSSGASRLSFHYSGRVVDINQALGSGRSQRYFIVKEIVIRWRVRERGAESGAAVCMV